MHVFQEEGSVFLVDRSTPLTFTAVFSLISEAFPVTDSVTHGVLERVVFLLS